MTTKPKFRVGRDRVLVEKYPLRRSALIHHPEEGPYGSSVKEDSEESLAWCNGEFGRAEVGRLLAIGAGVRTDAKVGDWVLWKQGAALEVMNQGAHRRPTMSIVTAQTLRDVVGSEHEAFLIHHDDLLAIIPKPLPGQVR